MPFVKIDEIKNRNICWKRRLEWKVGGGAGGSDDGKNGYADIVAWWNVGKYAKS